MESDKVNVERLREAIIKCYNHFYAFRLRLTEEDGTPYLTEVDDFNPDVKIEHCSTSEYQQIRDNFTQPFDIKNGPLFHSLIVCTEDYVYLLTDFFHIIYDGTSTTLFNKALASFYCGIEPEKERATICDIAKAEQLEAESHEADYKWFDEYMGGVDVDSNLIPDKAEKEDNTTDEYIESIKINTDDVSKHLKSNGCTESSLMYAAMAYNLAKFTCQSETMFCTVEHGRHTQEAMSAVGMQVRTFPLYFKIDEEAVCIDYIKSVKENFQSARSHDGVAFGRLAHQLGIKNDISFVYQGYILQNFKIGEAIVSICRMKQQEAITNLDLEIFKKGDGYQLLINYKTSLYSKEYIESFASTFTQILKGLLTKECLKDIELQTPETKIKIDEFNNTEAPYNKGQTVVDLLKKQVLSQPNAEAVYYEGKSITYAEFDAVTDKIASYITGKGIGSNCFVAILTGRSEMMPITAWGVVKAGAAYQPLDPSYPVERLNFMVNDSGARLLIADRELRPMLSEYKGDLLYTDEIEALPLASGYESKTKPSDAVIIIYTSGTTGTPKGCVIENGNLQCFVNHNIKTMGAHPGARCATYASFGFDAALMDIFTTIAGGGALYVMPEDIRLDIGSMEEYYVKHCITTGFMTTQVGRMFVESTSCKTLTHFMMGGEKLVPFTPQPGICCYNGYGPSETIAYITSYRIKDNSPLQPIGKAVPNAKLYVIDKYMRQLPIGAAGELCIAGPQVGREYLNRPDKTSEVFVSNPFCNNDGYERIYRTGDIVRYLPDGNLDFTGRRDGQVKVRGFRVELTEIEQIIRSYKGISNATVQAFDDPAGGKFIAAYIVSSSKIDTDELKRHIGAEKPAYMVPAVIMQIDAIPLNVNSKVDKRRLPQPEITFEDAIPPSTDIQKAVFDIVAEILGNRRFGINTNLYEAGLTSIGSIKLIALLSKKLNINIQIKDLKEADNIEAIEKMAQSSGIETDFGIQADYPLTKTQEGIFAECISTPDGTAYNIPLLLKIDNSIDTKRVKIAIKNAIEAHPYIKTRLFMNADGDVRLRRLDSDTECYNTAIQVVSTASIDTIKNGLIKPFTLLGGQLFRIVIIEAPNDKYLFIDMHHIISDGTSIDIFIEDIAASYNGTALVAERYSGFEKSLAEQDLLHSDALPKAKEYYEKLLGGFDENCLISSDLYHSEASGNGSLELSTEGAEVIKQLCSSDGISENGFYNAAFGFMLARYNALDYSRYATIYNGRSDSRFSTSMSMFVKTLPVVCNLSGTEKVKDLVQTISKQLTESMANDIYSFSDISRELGITADIIFIFQGELFKFDTFCKKPSQQLQLESENAKEPISLQVFTEGNIVRMHCEYRRDMFSDALIATLLRTYSNILNEFTKRRFLNEITIASEADIALIDSFNASEKPYNENQTAVDMFNNSVTAYPDKEAVVYKEKRISYSELNDLTNRLATYIASKGIGRDEFVSILIRRNEFMPITAWGVVKAGAAYQPLDPTYPAERLNFMVKDSKARLLIAERDLRPMLNEYDGDVIYTDEIASLPASEAQKSDIKPSDAIIIIYTSGTTGTPKGCVLEHKNFVCFTHNHAENSLLDSESRVATFASFGFDGGAMDIFSTLMIGGTLCIIPDEIRLDMDKLNEFFCNERITFGFMTTQVGRMFAEMTTCKTLKVFIVGGEKLVPFQPQQSFIFMNGYGPSETFCYVTHYIVKDDSPLQPIGVTSSNTKLYVIDKEGHLLPPGACGELCIAGNQVGREYLGRADKTAEAFTANPFCHKKGYERIYHTGDIVRYLPDGNIDFVGRRDGQVKIRGFRVELTEIEQIIRKFNGISDATVQAFDDPAGGKFIAAYIVSNSKINIDALHAFISAEKPPYMVPAVTMQIDTIPLNANSKVDKRKLPKPEVQAHKEGKKPSSKLEEQICEIFKFVLKSDNIYADDNFFEVGGSSISAAKVVLKCMENGLQVVYKNVFDNPTPEKLAQFLQGGTAVQGAETENKETISDTNIENKHLACNTIEYLDYIDKLPIGNVLLAGATGFLGMHVLKELLDTECRTIYCLVRGGERESAKERLKVMAMYYFGGIIDEARLDTLQVIDGDITEDNLCKRFESLNIDTIINCAACVKHFAAGDLIERINVIGVKNLIKVAINHSATLVQVSTLSVAGESVNGSVDPSVRMTETMHYFGQNVNDNKYIKSKFDAESAILEAMDKGLKAKIIRVGNLMSRSSDGEFQINSTTNGFMSRLKAYWALGCFSVNDLDAKVEFSPIDCTAKAVVTLAGTPEQFTVFHANNCHTVHFANILEAMEKQGFGIGVVKNQEFMERMKERLSDEKHGIEVSSLISYMDNSGDVRRMVGWDSSFTVKALYRLGFHWPIIDPKYIEQSIVKLKTLRFFNR